MNEIMFYIWFFVTLAQSFLCGWAWAEIHHERREKDEHERKLPEVKEYQEEYEWHDTTEDECAGYNVRRHY